KTVRNISRAMVSQSTAKGVPIGTAPVPGTATLLPQHCQQGSHKERNAIGQWRFTMERTGGCACGAIRFEITAPFIGVGACHCTDCQKASGGGPNYVALTPKGARVVTKGEEKCNPP